MVLYSPEGNFWQRTLFLFQDIWRTVNHEFDCIIIISRCFEVSTGQDNIC